MKTLWMRVGMEVEVSDSEYVKLMKEAGRNEAGEKTNVSIETYNYQELEKMVVSLIENGKLSGETFIVGKSCGGVDEYDNPESEISVQI